MLGSQNRFNQVTCLLINVGRLQNAAFFSVSEVSHRASHVSSQYLSMKDLGTLLGCESALLGREQTFHCSFSILNEYGEFALLQSIHAPSESFPHAFCLLRFL
jgi:hypothetical protein